MSGRSMKLRAWKATGTSSTWTDTLGCTAMENATVPMPPIASALLAGLSPWMMESVGTALGTSASVAIPLSPSCSIRSASPPAGTSLSFVGFRVAMTMTIAGPASAAFWTGVGGRGVGAGGVGRSTVRVMMPDSLKAKARWLPSSRRFRPSAVEKLPFRARLRRPETSGPA